MSLFSLQFVWLEKAWSLGTQAGPMYHHSSRLENSPRQQGWLRLLRPPARLERFDLEGLQIQVPPRRHDSEAHGTNAGSQNVPRLLISEINADGTVLKILPKKEGKEPLQFEMKQLVLRGIGPSDPMSFRAILTNAKPAGEIQSEGEFGPWQRHDPGLTTASGRYTFQHADLSVFRGISGTCRPRGLSRGSRHHPIGRTTDTPTSRSIPAAHGCI